MCAHDSRAEALFAAVYESPTDDAPRQVLADRLQEIDDPRGEFIALQLARARTNQPPTKRELALLKQHGAAWCGVLDRILSKQHRVFERGFLVVGRADGNWGPSGVASQRAAATITAVTGAAEWGTVERFTCPSGWPSGGRLGELVAALFADPAMRSLRVLHNVHYNTAVALERATPRLLVELGLFVHERKPTSIGTQGLRNVRRLVTGAFDDNFMWIWQSPVASKLEALTLEHVTFAWFGELHQKILKHAPPTLRTIGFMRDTRFPSAPEGWHLEFTRERVGKAMKLTTLDARFGTGQYKYEYVGDELAEALEAVGPTLSEIRIHSSPAYKPSAEQRARLATACKRFRHATVVLPD